jgi:hypothetical protein
MSLKERFPRQSIRALLLLLLSAVFWDGRPALAQQTIINLPSADLTPKGQHFLMHESQLLPAYPREFWGSTNFYTFGLSDQTELAVTTYNFNSYGSENGSVGVGFKRVQPLFRRRLRRLELKQTVGAMVPVSMTGRGVGAFGYTHTSFRLPRLKTRLTAGIAAATRQTFDEDMVSFIAGLEQPLSRHLIFNVEWFSGTQHAAANLIPGFTYHRKGWILVGGIKIPNDMEPEKFGLVFEIGRFLGPGSGEEHEDEERHEKNQRTQEQQELSPIQAEERQREGLEAQQEGAAPSHPLPELILPEPTPSLEVLPVVDIESFKTPSCS